MPRSTPNGPRFLSGIRSQRSASAASSRSASSLRGTAGDASFPSLPMPLATDGVVAALTAPVRAFVLARVLGGSDAADQAEIRRRTESLEALLRPAPPPADPAPPSLPLDGYAGAYDSPLYGRFVVVRDGDGIRIEAGSARFPGALVHFGRDTFQVSWPPVDYGHQLVTFTAGPDGQAVAFDTETYGRFERAAP